MPQLRLARAGVAVIKIGGSVLDSQDSYRRVAEFIRNRLNRAPDERLVIVVSAQNGVTDSLARLAKQVVAQPDSAALDLLWSTGELRSVALLTLHLQSLGIKAAALNVHSTGLRLRKDESYAERIEINTLHLRSALAHHLAVIVPGFLAKGPADTIVSLGRGGSDLTAVLLAEGLRARRCELIKDVPGYFASDPRRDPQARHVPLLSFEQASAMADEGCDVVQRQAIETAARAGRPLLIRSLNDSAPKSWIAQAQGNATWNDLIRLGVTVTQTVMDSSDLTPES